MAIVELNRPEVLNAMDITMLHELNEVLAQVAKSAAEVVILTGSGRGFSAGGDIKSMLLEVNEDAFSPIMDMITGMMVTLYTMPKLVISAVHGPAAGLGFSFALAADYLVASSSAKFAMNFIGIGLIPDGGGHFFVEKRLGSEKAKQLIWEGKTQLAEEALAAGLIDEVTNQDVLTRAKEIATEWHTKPIRAMIETKVIYAKANLSRLEQILALEKVGQSAMRKSEDHQEGIRAFIEKRPPVYKGK